MSNPKNCRRPVDTSLFTEEAREAFVDGWTAVGGYTGDVGTDCPWCAPWTWGPEIKVAGVTPRERGAAWWAICAGEVTRLLDEEACAKAREAEAREAD